MTCCISQSSNDPTQYARMQDNPGFQNTPGKLGLIPPCFNDVELKQVQEGIEYTSGRSLYYFSLINLYQQQSDPKPQPESIDSLSQKINTIVTDFIDKNADEPGDRSFYFLFKENSNQISPEIQDPFTKVRQYLRSHRMGESQHHLPYLVINGNKAGGVILLSNSLPIESPWSDRFFSGNLLEEPVRCKHNNLFEKKFLVSWIKLKVKQRSSRADGSDTTSIKVPCPCCLNNAKPDHIITLERAQRIDHVAKNVTSLYVEMQKSSCSKWLLRCCCCCTSGIKKAIDHLLEDQNMLSSIPDDDDDDHSYRSERSFDRFRDARISNENTRISSEEPC
jgi:hypothetical protein